MKNIDIKRKGNVLTITVDLSVAGEPSKSGKTKTIASTNGFHTLPAVEGDKSTILVGININRKE